METSVGNPKEPINEREGEGLIRASANERNPGLEGPRCGVNGGELVSEQSPPYAGQWVSAVWLTLQVRCFMGCEPGPR